MPPAPRQPMPLLDLPARRATFGEIARGFSPAEAVAEAKRCILCKVPGCAVRGCPLHNLIPQWIKLIQEEKFTDAAALSRTTSSMPEICARVCPQDKLCEGACALGIKHEAVAIGALERFINDWVRDRGDLPLPIGAPTGRTVAVVGAGPAGMAAAEQLRAAGHAVVVFDALAEPGGLLASGLPGFKLPAEVTRHRWRLLAEAGVTFEGGRRIGSRQDLDGHPAGPFAAVFLAVGAWQPVVPDLPGKDLPGVVQALPFLHGGADGIPVAGKTVVVLGGGDTAMDCARTAIRRGAARTRIVYRRDEPNMPGSRKEVKMAREEGVAFDFLVHPLAFTAGPDGRLAAVRAQRTELGEPDARGRRSPRPVAGSEYEAPADLAVMAFGYRPDTPWLARELGVALTPADTIVVDPATGATSVPGIYAGGDCTLGADLVTRAVAAGRTAAAGINALLATPPAAVPVAA